MRKTKIFKSGNSWAVRLPQGFSFRQGEVEIFKRGNEVVIREVPENLKAAFLLLSKLPEDFYDKSRKDSAPQKRDF